MKITVEFELNDSYEAYYSNDKNRIEAILADGLDGVKFNIIKTPVICSNGKAWQWQYCQTHIDNINGCKNCRYFKK